MLDIDQDAAIIILAELRHLKRFGPSDLELGICYHCDTFESLGPRLLCKEVYRGWPHYSGNPIYPVPSPAVSSGLDEEELFYKGGNMWVGDYGKLRLNLLDYLIEYFTKLVLELEQCTTT